MKERIIAGLLLILVAFAAYGTTNPYAPTTPADNTPIKAGAEHIRDMKSVLANYSGQFKRGSGGKFGGSIMGNASTATRALNANNATNAHTVDSFHASQTPSANQIVVVGATSSTTLPGALIIPNNTWLAAKGSDNNNKMLATITDIDQVVFGSTGLPLFLQGSGTTANYNGYGIWHSNNDGSGSGLDADTLDTKDSTDFPYTRSESGLRIVRGTINVGSQPGYTISSTGSGFSPTRNSQGSYTVAFTNAFSSTPTVVFSTAINGDTGVPVYCVLVGSQPTTSSFEVTCLNTSTNLSDPQRLSFIAIGPN